MHVRFGEKRNGGKYCARRCGSSDRRCCLYSCLYSCPLFFDDTEFAFRVSGAALEVGGVLLVALGIEDHRDIARKWLQDFRSAIGREIIRGVLGGIVGSKRR